MDIEQNQEIVIHPRLKGGGEKPKMNIKAEPYIGIGDLDYLMDTYFGDNYTTNSNSN